ncbi:hypothetical protein PMG11_11001 [Penicillium brasilianum]|uniref:Azaphilone pigments biosynthesis cluster protein L N-terminal domain-containing protein n=1 Tax=Penicillium brasilianum TaxID=104259 RepID=A0A0F7U0S1_PENBI|nr:hypothetical protein PMG11_11001 [Penicillium brasilianum]
MAEAAVGLASAILTLTIFTFDTGKSLYEVLSSFRSQKKGIRDLKTELSSLLSIVATIREDVERSKEAERFEPLRQPLENCSITCREIREMLDACTIHSNGESDSVRDWLSLRFHERSFEEMKHRLSSYKSTLNICFELINGRNHTRTLNSLNELEGLIRGTREDLEEQLDRVLRTVNDSDALSQENLRADYARLKSSIESLSQAHKVIDTNHPKIVVEDNRAGPDSRAIFGTDTTQPHFMLNVSNNEAGKGALMGAGIYTSQTLRELLRDSRASETTLALQSLQTQPHSTDDTDIQSLLHSFSVQCKQELPSTSEVSSSRRLIISEHVSTTETLYPPTTPP